MTFKDFNFDPRLLEGIESMGFLKPTPVQELVIPLITDGKDIIASSQTGSGKTAAYLLPLINKMISSPEHKHIKALVVVPTRELAVQIDQQMEGLSYFVPINSIAVYGGGDGSSFSREKQALTQGADMIITTPGRFIAHLNMGYVKLNELQYLILDEADRMLDIGFYDDIMKITSHIPKERQTLLFSATVPHEIKRLAKSVLQNPAEVNLNLSKPPDKIKQEAYIVYDNQKVTLVKDILKARKLRSVLVFCSTKSSTKILNKELQRAGLSSSDIHSDLEQAEREKVLRSFKNRELNILVATDILSRGIDIEDIDMVINFDVPHDAEDYVHRIGRTARAESNGEAITLVNEADQQKFSTIEKLLGKEVPKMILPEKYGPAPEYNPTMRRKPSGNRNFKGRGNKNSHRPRR